MFVHRVLTAAESVIEHRVGREINAMLCTEIHQLETVVLPYNKERAFMEDPVGIPADLLDRMQWLVNTYINKPQMNNIEDVPSTIFARAPEIRTIAARRKKTYTFSATHSWLDVGLQVLKRSGWWPECSRPHTKNL